MLCAQQMKKFNRDSIDEALFVVLTAISRNIANLPENGFQNHIALLNF
jgi:hypothetical protein